MAGDGPRRYGRRRRGAPAGPAVAVGAGRAAAVRPVRRSRRDAATGPVASRGEPRAGADPRRAVAGRSFARRAGSAGPRRAAAPARAAPGSRMPRAPRRIWVPSRPEVIEILDREGLLPAITFIFSRAGCDAAVAQCLSAGLRLATPDERTRIREHARDRTADLSDADLRVLGYWEWLDGLERGIAAHHAGLLPRFKEITEELFAGGLVKAVFATETLALGINMPARSVVLERLVKYNGETHVELTAGEYTQLTGRAGRRGIDVEGHAVVLWTTGFDPEQVAGLASTRTYPLRSSFRPSYNMAVNLVGVDGPRAGPRAAGVVVRPVPGRPGGGRAGPSGASPRRGHRRLRGGDALRARVGRRSTRGCAASCPRRETELARERSSQRRLQAGESLRRLRTGDVIRVPAGRRAGLAVVLSEGAAVPETGRLVVLTADRQVKRLSVGDFPTPVEALGQGPGRPQLQPALAAVPPRPGVVAARPRSRRRAAGEPGAGAAATSRPGPTTRSPGCDASCASIRCTTARSASSTCAGRSGPTGCAARAPGSSSGSRAAPTRSPAPSTGSAGCSRSSGYLDPAERRGRGRRRSTAGGPAGSPGSTPSRTCWWPSACAQGSGTSSTPPGAGRRRVRAGLRVAHRRAPRAGAARRPGGARGARRDRRAACAS